MKILIVEDEASSRHLLKSLLSGYGACELAEDGPVAVEMFKAALSSGQHYDLVTLDIKLPTMDGMEVLRSIRRIESDHIIGDMLRRVQGAGESAPLLEAAWVHLQVRDLRLQREAEATETAA